MGEHCRPRSGKQVPGPAWQSKRHHHGPRHQETESVRIVLQRVERASVRVAGIDVATIGSGLLLLVGVEAEDDAVAVAAAADKVLGLRVFPDQAGNMNRNVVEHGGEILVVPQFTLAASTRRGRRPSFSGVAPRAVAIAVLGDLVTRLRASGLQVLEGRFGEAMAVELVNDGPVTFHLEFGASEPSSRIPAPG